MARSVQLSLFGGFSKKHGGTLSEGRRKVARPLVTRRAMHLVFRAKSSGLHRHAKAIRELQQKLSARYQVQLYEASNNDNHLHQLVRAKSREGLRNYLRTFAGQVAQLVTGAKRGKKSSGFWLVPVFSRIIEWGQDFFGTKRYVIQNQLEALGLIPYQPRTSPNKLRAAIGPLWEPDEPARH